MKCKRSRRKPACPQPDAVDLADQALDHCRNIRSLARLLRVADSSVTSEALPKQTVANAANLIGEQTARLQYLIHEFHRRLKGHRAGPR